MILSVLPAMECALQQNETVNIFASALSNFGDDDNVVGNKMENQLKETRNFTDLEYSKNKSLTCIDWHPTRKGVLAVSVCKSLSFDERVTISGQVEVAYVIIWEFAEWIKPQLVLQSPHECFTFKFNPTMPDIVCGGCYSGQAIMWNLTENMKQIEKKKKDKKGGKEKSGVGDDDDDEQGNIVVLPTSLSNIDSSHKRMIADMEWLPPDTQINAKGQFLAEEHLDGKTYQFITIAGDGLCLIWDIRYEDIMKGNLLHIYKPKATSLGDKAKQEASKTLWKPIFKMNVKRLDGVGELSLCKVLSGLGGADQNHNTIDRRSQMFCCSEEGDLVYADWRAKPSSRSESSGGKEDEEDGSDVPEYVQWIEKDHFRPCVAISRSPFFNDTIVTVGDWSFHIWKIEQVNRTGQQIPIFSSPNSSTYLTGGRWSPTRPGMLLISKADGCVDVWDFTDSSYRPSSTLMTTTSRITSMEFLSGKMASTKQQFLAVGDGVGSLHVFDVPRSLWKPIQNEKKIIKAFFEREMKKIAYVDQRKIIRDEEFANSRAKEGGDNVAGAGRDADHNAPDSINDEDKAMLLQEENEYKKLEAKLVEQLQLKRADLPADFDFSKLSLADEK